MKTSTKTLLVSVLAIACAGGAYAQGAGGSAGGGGGTGAGTRGGAAPDGNTLQQPGIQPGMNGGNVANGNGNTANGNTTGGYGSPGATGENSGRSTMSPGMNHRGRHSTTGDPTSPQQDQLYRGGHQQ